MIRKLFRIKHVPFDPPQPDPFALPEFRAQVRALDAAVHALTFGVPEPDEDTPVYADALADFLGVPTEDVAA